MIGMQYKVILPKDYDMDIIRKRVEDNGYKTDGFQELNFKAYLITEAGKEGISITVMHLYIFGMVMKE